MKNKSKSKKKKTNDEPVACINRGNNKGWELTNTWLRGTEATASWTSLVLAMTWSANLRTSEGERLTRTINPGSSAAIQKRINKDQQNMHQWNEV